MAFRPDGHQARVLQDLKVLAHRLLADIEVGGDLVDRAGPITDEEEHGAAPGLGQGRERGFRRHGHRITRLALYKALLVESRSVRHGTGYAGFLRGVNMIGRRTVKMAELRRIFESMDFSDVRTILASGNVVFGSKRSNIAALSARIEQRIEPEFGYPVRVIVRSLDELESIAATNPFRGVPASPRTKLLVTLLSERPAGRFMGPYTSPEKDFKVLRVEDRTVFSVVTLDGDRRSSGVMSFLERQFGTEQTSRNWNTIVRVLQAWKEGA